MTLDSSTMSNVIWYVAIGAWAFRAGWWLRGRKAKHDYADLQNEIDNLETDVHSLSRSFKRKPVTGFYSRPAQAKETK